MNKKIFRSILLTAVIVMIVSIAIIMGCLYAYFTNEQKEQLKIETQLAARGVELNQESYLEGFNETDYRITWIAEDGTVLFDNEANSSNMENHLEREEVKEALESGYGESTRHSDTIGQNLFYSAIRLSDGSVLRLSSSQKTIWLLLAGFIQPICIVIVVALIITIILAFRLSKKIVEPINNIDPDKPLQYIDKEGYSEVEPLLRKMRSQQIEVEKSQKELERTSQIRQEFTANVSHELKTPLHSISGYAELIENGIAKEEDIKPFAGKIRQESTRLSALVEDIIQLTKLDRGNVNENFQMIDVYTLAENVIDSLKSSADEKNVSIILKGENALMEGAPGVVHSIIYNLLDNAIKYNKPNGSVNVLVNDRDNRIIVCVKDTGIGIPSDDIDRVFERFYRVNKSHSKEIGGTGLGLSIVKHGLDVLGAQITLSSNVGEGTEFTVTFPKHATLSLHKADT